MRRFIIDFKETSQSVDIAIDWGCVEESPARKAVPPATKLENDFADRARVQFMLLFMALQPFARGSGKTAGEADFSCGIDQDIQEAGER